MKSLVILAVLCLISYALWQKWQRIPAQTKQIWGALFGMAGALREAKKQAKQQNEAATQSAGTNLMLPCAKCGLHVLENEGLHAHGGFYCCVEHART